MTGNSTASLLWATLFITTHRCGITADATSIHLSAFIMNKTLRFSKSKIWKTTGLWHKVGTSSISHWEAWHQTQRWVGILIPATSQLSAGHSSVSWRSPPDKTNLAISSEPIRDESEDTKVVAFCSRSVSLSVHNFYGQNLYDYLLVQLKQHSTSLSTKWLFSLSIMDFVQAQQSKLLLYS